MKPELHIETVISKHFQSSGRTDTYGFLLWLMHNRLLYWYAKTKKMQDRRTMAVHIDIAKAGDACIRQNSRTIALAERLSRKHKLEYIIAKYDRPLPYISSDIDLLVKNPDMDAWAQLFADNGFTVSGHQEFLNRREFQLTVEKTGYSKIDLTSRFTWQQTAYFDDDFLWRNYNPVTHRMDVHAEMAVNVGSVLFKRMYFTLLDYVYFVSGNPDDNRIRLQTRKYGWERQYDLFLEILSSIQPLNSKFPYLFSFSNCRHLFDLKRADRLFRHNAWLYFLLSRIRYSLFREYLPYHVFWYPIKKLKILTGKKVSL